MKTSIITLVFGVGLLAAQAEEIDVSFSYSNKNLETGICGMGVRDTYDVCILLKNAGLTAQGARITGMEVPVVNEPAVTNYKAWVSTTLGGYMTAGEEYIPDLTVKEGVAEEGWLRVTFDEPIDLPEEGLYVGYSFDVRNIDRQGEKYPVAMTNEYKANSLYMRCRQNTPNWVNVAEENRFCSAMSVNLRGNFSQDKIGIAEAKDVFGTPEKQAVASIMVMNEGVTAITEIEYVYTFEGRTIEGTHTFKPAISDVMGTTADISLDLEQAESYGDHAVDFTITKVNGNPNSSDNATAQFRYVSVEKMPVRRTVVEEYTGTWCQFCPRGIAGLEYLQEKDPNVITIAYHYQDPMEMMTPFEFSKAYTFPCCWLDKTVGGDPLTGTGNSVAYGRIWIDYTDRMKVDAPASISLSTRWADDSMETLEIDAEVEFIYTPRDGADYRIAYVLVEDGLTAPNPDDKDWWQVNNYSKLSGYDNALTLSKFTKMDNPIRDMVYNEVAVYATDYNGVPGSLSNVTGGTKMTHHHTISMSECINKQRERIVQHPENTRVIAMVVRSKDGSNEVLNATMAESGSDSRNIDPLDPGSVEESMAEGYVTATEFYDISGSRVMRPSAGGLYIKLTRYNTGKATIEKIIFPN